MGNKGKKTGNGNGQVPNRERGKTKGKAISCKSHPKKRLGEVSKNQRPAAGNVWRKEGTNPEKGNPICKIHSIDLREGNGLITQVRLKAGFVDPKGGKPKTTEAERGQKTKTLLTERGHVRCRGRSIQKKVGVGKAARLVTKGGQS